MVGRDALVPDIDGRLVRPEVRALFEKMRQYPIAHYDELGVEKARRLVEDSARSQGRPREMSSVRDLDVAGRDGTGIRVRVYRPIAPHSALIVFLHGGGWVTGSVDGSDTTCRTIADELRCAVASVEYRRAPESPYPAALHDAEDALLALAGLRKELGLDEHRLVLMGDSAGAQLAISTATRQPSVVTDLVALYPAIAPPVEPHVGSWAANGLDPVLSARTMDWFWRLYLGDDEKARDEIEQVAQQYADLPRTLVITCGLDVLDDEGRKFAGAAASAGVDLTHVHFDGMVHGFLSLAKFLPTADQALQTAAGWMHESGAHPHG